MSGTIHKCDGRTLTTGECARFCNTSARTVSKWCDSGRLSCVRLPGSLDRRIYREDLIEFMSSHGLRLPPELTGATRTLSFGLQPGECVGLLAASAFDLGVLAACEEPRAIVLGDAEGVALAVRIAESIRALYPSCAITVVLSEDAPAIEFADVRVIRRPCDLNQLLAAA